MLYDLLKIGHLASMVLWMGAAVTTLMGALALAPMPTKDPDMAAIGAFRRAYRWLGGPGIVGTWGFGLALLSFGGWLHAPWLWAKIGVALLLSGLHGALSGRLRRLENTGAGQAMPTGFFVTLLVLHAAALLTVLALVTLRPL